MAERAGVMSCDWLAGVRRLGHGMLSGLWLTTSKGRWKRLACRFAKDSRSVSSLWRRASLLDTSPLVP